MAAVGLDSARDLSHLEHCATLESKDSWRTFLYISPRALAAELEGHESLDLDADSPMNFVSADEFPSGAQQTSPIHTKRCRLLAL